MSRLLSSLPISITDLETTGLRPDVHEIVEIGLLVIDQTSFEILDTFDVKVRPEHPERATKGALETNGYNPAQWSNAVTIEEAIREYGRKTADTIFCSHNVTFDWSFTYEAFRKTGVENRMDYHRLDLFTMAWTLLKGTNIERYNLNKVAAYFGLNEEPVPHRAINGATIAYEVFKRLIALNSNQK